MLPASLWTQVRPGNCCLSGHSTDMYHSRQAGGCCVMSAQVCPGPEGGRKCGGVGCLGAGTGGLVEPLAFWALGISCAHSCLLPHWCLQLCYLPIHLLSSSFCFQGFLTVSDLWKMLLILLMPFVFQDLSVVISVITVGGAGEETVACLICWPDSTLPHHFVVSQNLVICPIIYLCISKMYSLVRS